MLQICRSNASAAVILIRLMVGLVFISEGTQKFLYPAEIGAGRFAKIGIPAPEILAPTVACFEIACGMLIITGFGTRVAVVPLIIIMFTAIASTKVPILMSKGFWNMAHEARTDWSMLLGSIYLLIVGSGPWSVDGNLTDVDRQRDRS